MKEKPQAECAWCGKAFEPERRNHIYCGRQCRDDKEVARRREQRDSLRKRKEKERKQNEKERKQEERQKEKERKRKERKRKEKERRKKKERKESFEAYHRQVLSPLPPSYGFRKMPEFKGKTKASPRKEKASPEEEPYKLEERNSLDELYELEDDFLELETSSDDANSDEAPPPVDVEQAYKNTGLNREVVEGVGTIVGKAIGKVLKDFFWK